MNARLTVLGSGTSMGVPTIGCTCAVCHSADPHDRRTRPSILLEYAGKVVLIDTTPDFREQAIREGIRQLDAVLYTHAHADHILGLDDVRPLSFHRPNRIPLYARPEAAALLRNMFRYIFDANYKFGGLAQVELNTIEGPVELFGAQFDPVKVMHGDSEISVTASGPPLTSPTSARCQKSLSPSSTISTFFFSTPCAINRTPPIRRWTTR